MRIGPRRPSLRRRLAARASWKRYVRHSLGLKAPRGWGWVTNPKRAAYNRAYTRLTFDPLKPPRRTRQGEGKADGLFVRIVVLAFVALVILLLRGAGHGRFVAY